MSHNDPGLDAQSRRHRCPIVAMVALVALVIAGLFWWMNREIATSAPVPPERAETVAPADPATTGPGALSEPPSAPVSPAPRN